MDMHPELVELLESFRSQLQDGYLQEAFATQERMIAEGATDDEIAEVISYIPKARPYTIECVVSESVREAAKTEECATLVWRAMMAADKRPFASQKANDYGVLVERLTHFDWMVSIMAIEELKAALDEIREYLATRQREEWSLPED